MMPTMNIDEGRKEEGGIVALCYSEAKRPWKVRPLPSA